MSLQSVPVLSEGALQQTVAATAGRTLVLPAEPVHHVTGVSSVSTAQAEVGGAAYGHVADGALEGETLTDGTLSPASLTATVTAVHPELCRGTNNKHRSETLRSIGLKPAENTDVCGSGSASLASLTSNTEQEPTSRNKSDCFC